MNLGVLNCVSTKENWNTACEKKKVMYKEFELEIYRSKENKEMATKTVQIAENFIISMKI